jgi:hypothetical protein
VSILLGGWIKCRKCGAERYKQQAYQYWHNVDCFESITSPNDLISITWIKNWWVCSVCYKSEYRFHDIDGFAYFLSWKFPFITRG